MGSIYAHGVPERAIENITLTTHDWGNASEWQDGNSAFVLKPGPGEVWVLCECRMKFSAGMFFDPAQSLLIEGGIPGFEGIVPITSYQSVKDFVKRADDMSEIDFQTPFGDFTHSIIEARLYFSEQVILWSSARMSETGPNRDILGCLKLGSITARIANNQPFTMAEDGSPPEIAVCRYHLTIYQDPDA